MRIECDRMDIRICRIDRKDSTKCIIRSISPGNNLGIQHSQCANTSADVKTSLKAANTCLYNSEKFHEALLHVKHMSRTTILE